MTLDQVRISVAAIADMSGYESARTADDTLRNRVLEAIAAGAENAQELAAEALKHRLRFEDGEVVDGDLTFKACKTSS